MLNSLLSIIAEDDGNWYFDNYGEPFIYAIIGFLIVIVGIVILIGIIWLLGFVMRKTNNLAFLTERKSRKKNKIAQIENSEVKNPEPVTEDGEIPDEVKVAIIAAIMAYYEEREEKCEFTVKRIKRL